MDRDQTYVKYPQVLLNDGMFMSAHMGFAVITWLSGETTIEPWAGNTVRSVYDADSTSRQVTKFQEQVERSKVWLKHEDGERANPLNFSKIEWVHPARYQDEAVPMRVRRW